MLNTGDFGEWKVQGKVGGYSKFVPQFKHVWKSFLTLGLATRTKSEGFSMRAVYTESDWDGIFQDLILRRGRRGIFRKGSPMPPQELDFS